MLAISTFASQVALAVILGAGAAHAMPARVVSDHAAANAIVRVMDRPEIRSYQPHSGLQYGFRPTPPPQRGVRRQRPEVVMPVPISPLIERGVPDSYSAQWYVYCAQKYQSFDPGTGLYTTFSGARRLCR
jgi:hypothetical protein